MRIFLEYNTEIIRYVVMYFFHPLSEAIPRSVLVRHRYCDPAYGRNEFSKKNARGVPFHPGMECAPRLQLRCRRSKTLYT